MSEHCGAMTRHTKQRGKIRCCEWCGQNIIIGEKYDKWLYFDGGQRSTVYAHEECSDEWQRIAADEQDVVYASRDCERPPRKERKDQPK